jgi:hypothetical protein
MRIDLTGISLVALDRKQTELQVSDMIAITFESNNSATLLPRFNGKLPNCLGFAKDRIDSIAFPPRQHLTKIAA